MSDIETRAKLFANYIIENRATVRATAKAFDISKSTVHKDVAERLKKFNPSLAEEAKKVLEINLLMCYKNIVLVMRYKKKGID